MGRGIAVLLVIHLLTARVSAAENALLAGSSSDLLLVVVFVFLPAVLFMIAGKLFYRWWCRHRSQRRPVSLDPPLSRPSDNSLDTPQTVEETAIMELRNIRSLYDAGRSQEFAEAIAVLVRRYVSNCYKVKVVDATTSQILANLPQSLSDGIVDHVGEILHTCDSFMLSRHRPSRTELDRLYQSTVEFFERQGAVEAELEEPSTDTETPEDEEEFQEILRRYFPR